MEDVEAIDVKSVQMWDAKGIHHLQISWDAVAKVAYPPLEAAMVVVMRHLHNKMCQITQCQCTPTSSNDTRAGKFVSLVVLM